MNNWTRIKPDVPGVYAVRGFDFGNPTAAAVVEVEVVNDELCCNLHESNSEHDSEQKWSRLANYGEFEWFSLGEMPE